ncbi:hypothetical protein ACH4UM_39625 [Streptomyces sp. NPDC020801]|uniref:hypothetical protein n=1 Tax=unclassified Streptomyces TaxID=2593676 RepID=UPI00378E1893
MRPGLSFVEPCASSTLSTSRGDGTDLYNGANRHPGAHRLPRGRPSNGLPGPHTFHSRHHYHDM